MSPYVTWDIFFFQKGEAFSLISFLFQSISAALLVFTLPILPCPIRSLLPHVRPPRIVMKPKEVTNLLGERRRREGFGRGSLLKKIYDQIQSIFGRFIFHLILLLQYIFYLHKYLYLSIHYFVLVLVSSFFFLSGDKYILYIYTVIYKQSA